MCSLCNSNPCDPRCPNYILPRALFHCSACGEGIYDGEEYVENENGDVRHFECFDSMREILSWLGHDIKTMEDFRNGF